jgi:hypothetical protein
MAVPWYSYTWNDCGHNIVLSTDTDGAAAAATLRQAHGIAVTGQRVGVWLGDELLAVAERTNGTVYVKIVPALRHRVALPWRTT